MSNFFSSVLVKPCPHCDQAINVLSLKKIEQKSQLCWYQITPAARTACPVCGGFVVFTAANSPSIAAALGVLFTIIFAAILFPEVDAILKMLPGGEYFFIAIIAPVIFLILKRESLEKDDT